MLSLIILFNCIPNTEVFANAMSLFISEYGEHINDHIPQKYLKPKHPRKLGGRAAGPQGMVGSTNGLERRNGVWKKNYGSILLDKLCNAIFLRIIEGEVH